MYLLSFPETQMKSGGQRAALNSKFLRGIERAATRSAAPQRELRCTCERFKFNQAFRAGHLIFRLKLLQNSGSVVGPHSGPPTSSNLLTQSLWRDGIYPALHSSAGTTVCVVGGYDQRPAEDQGNLEWELQRFSKKSRNLFRATYLRFTS